MPDRIRLLINGREYEADAGTTVASAVWNAGEWRFRTSESGEPRAPLCGMGICFECRLTIDGEFHARSCQVICRDGMRVETE